MIHLSCTIVTKHFVFLACIALQNDHQIFKAFKLNQSIHSIAELAIFTRLARFKQ
jgi:hypothetical protein